MNIKRIRNLLNINSFGDAEDMGDTSDNHMNDFEEEDKEVPPDSLKTYSDPYTDATYTYYRPSYTLKPTQKVLLNKKWGDIKM